MSAYSRLMPVIWWCFSESS